MKITNATLSRLWDALHALDGTPKSEGVAEVRYEFPGKVLYAIARNINHLRGQKVVLEKATDAIVRKHTGGQPFITKDNPAFAACNDELQEIVDAEVEVEVYRMKLADLNLDKNHLRPSTLAALDAVIDPE